MKTCLTPLEHAWLDGLVPWSLEVAQRHQRLASALRFKACEMIECAERLKQRNGNLADYAYWRLQAIAEGLVKDAEGYEALLTQGASR